MNIQSRTQFDIVKMLLLSICILGYNIELSGVNMIYMLLIFNCI